MNPYDTLPPRSFWRSAIAEREWAAVGDLWTPKFPYTRATRFATAGSCFAQHISRALKAKGYAWVDGEPAPPYLRDDPATAALFNYGVFSFRTGNIYTTGLLKQWVEWAAGIEPVSDEIWEENGRYFDPFRPRIEPDGFATAEEVFASRGSTLRAIKHVFEQADVFVFTLGLTEAWTNRVTGVVYPMCPGTSAGTFDPTRHQFENYDYPETREKLFAALQGIRRINPDIRFLLTVSPVPLTATATGEHVLVATTYSKSVLRAVAGQFAAQRDDCDYFPSYEIIIGHPGKGVFFERNLRNVSQAGVDFVMGHFLASVQGDEPLPITRPEGGNEPDTAADDEVCEEAILEYFNAR